MHAVKRNVDLLKCNVDENTQCPKSTLINFFFVFFFGKITYDLRWDSWKSKIETIQIMHLLSLPISPSLFLPTIFCTYINLTNMCTFQSLKNHFVKHQSLSVWWLVLLNRIYIPWLHANITFFNLVWIGPKNQTSEFRIRGRVPQCIVHSTVHFTYS